MKSRRQRKRKEVLDFFTDLAGFTIKYRRVFFTAMTALYEWFHPE